MGMLDQAADVGLPYSDGTSDGAVAVDDLAASSVRYLIPARWRGKIVTFQADGQDFYIGFGGDTVAASKTQKSSIAANAITFAAGSSAVVPSGQERPFHVPVDPAVTSFAIIAASASGQWRAYMSVGKGSQQ